MMGTVARFITFPLQLIYDTFGALKLVWNFIRRINIVETNSNTQPRIEENEDTLSAASLELQERIMNRRIRQEQDEAYMESLRADQEKDRKKQEEKLKKETEERQRKQKEMEEAKQRERLLELKVTLADKIPPEPSSSDPDAIRVVIKLPNGTRLKRRYHKTDHLKYLYYFVFCHEQAPVHFQITTNFPRKNLPGSPPTLENTECNETNGDFCNISNNDGPLTFESIGLGKSEVLFVHDLEA
ncbi:FAS-associated factor 2-like [Panonychus citri]|uniref:FAS-associated factor 2-like n=1 Tax=Panonychus citri TaxID=50023 RepID=UPI0023071EDB|nr:FAS-associated factor 2-like [Panonychus citri]